MATIPKALARKIGKDLVKQSDTFAEAEARIAGKKAKDAQSFDEHMQQALEEYEESLHFERDFNAGFTDAPPVADDLDNLIPKKKLTFEEQLKQIENGGDEQALIKQREHDLFSPKAEANFGELVQTATPEEFAKRLNEQLFDIDYGIRAVSDGTLDTHRLAKLTKTIERNDNLIQKIFTNQSNNPRWLARVEDFTKDSPYKNRIYFHTERQSDPIRGHESFIQYDRPREQGIHLGSIDAAEHFMGPGGLEAGFKAMDEFNQTVSDAARILGRDAKDLEIQIARSMEAHLVRKFSGGETLLDDFWDNIKETLMDLAESFGAQNPQVGASFVSSAKELPTSNLTPAIFAGKNGLYLSDAGGFGVNQVVTQLDEIFPELQREIAAAASGGQVEANKGLQKFIESQGYDHIVYHNSIEDKGSLSIINWNPDLMKSVWDESFTRADPNQAAKVATSFAMGVMGIGELREE